MSFCYLKTDYHHTCDEQLAMFKICMLVTTDSMLKMMMSQIKSTLFTACSFLGWKHWPQQTHNCVQFKVDLVYLQLPLHLFLQPYFMSSQHALVASGRAVQNGHQWSSRFTQPHDGDGTVGNANSSCPPIWPTCPQLCHNRLHHAYISDLMVALVLND